MNKENSKEYFKTKNRSAFSIKLNPLEKTIIEKKMEEEGWQNISRFIKSKIFDRNPEEEIEKIINEKKPADIVNLLKNSVLELSRKTDYFRFRYEKDMAQLYREEGVDINRWIKATNDWHARYVFETQKLFSTIRKIARALELDDYFSMPSDNMKLSENPTQEEMDRMAEQLRIERIALGYNDDLYL